jgi:hypothetical protein
MQKSTRHCFPRLEIGTVLLISALCVFTGIAMGDSTSAVPEQLNADTVRPNNSTFVLGEKVAITFQASGLPPSKGINLSINVSDEFGAPISSASLPMNSDSSGHASASYTAPSSKYGYYHVQAALADGTALAALGTRPAGFVTYAVVPDPSKRVNYGDTASRFGMQGGFNAAQGDVIPFLGVRFFLAGPGWDELEKNHAGQFDMARRAAAARGQPYPAKSAATSNLTYNGAPWATYGVALLTAAKLPPWALLTGTGGSICKTMGALNAAGVEALPEFSRALAAAVSDSYPGQSSHYYQVTWEPANWCFAGTPQQLVQFYQLSYGPIHQIDPKAIVMGPTLFTADGAKLSELWTLGFANYVDAVSMHPYVKFPPETNDLIENVRTQMKMARDAKGHSVPFIGTEHGYTSSSIGELNEALGNIRSTLILLGEGFKLDFAFYIADFGTNNPNDPKTSYGYYWNLNPKIAYGSDKIAPKSTAPAYAAMTFLLDGSTSDGPLSNLSGTQLGYRFKRNGTTILALWDYQASSSALSLATPGGSAQVCDWMGNCSAAPSGATINLKLGAAPIYVMGRNL